MSGSQGSSRFSGSTGVHAHAGQTKGETGRESQAAGLYWEQEGTMRLHAVALCALAGCVTMTPQQTAQSRRNLSAPVIGCPAAQVQVPEVPSGTGTWTATCRGETYACHGEVVGGVFMKFIVVCDPLPAKG